MYKSVEIFNFISQYVIMQLVEDRGYTAAAAVKTWESSKTYAELFKSENDYTCVSGPRAYEELEREINNDPFWFSFPFSG